MKYYYGNSYKEAVSNSPVEINSSKVLKQYQEVYNVVIPEDEVEVEHEGGLTAYVVSFDEDNINLYQEFENKEQAFAYAKENVANKPCVTKCWQPDTDCELGESDDYEEEDITGEDEQLMEMIENNL